MGVQQRGDEHKQHEHHSGSHDEHEHPSPFDGSHNEPNEAQRDDPQSTSGPLLSTGTDKISETAPAEALTNTRTVQSSLKTTAEQTAAQTPSSSITSRTLQSVPSASSGGQPTRTTAGLTSLTSFGNDPETTRPTSPITQPSATLPEAPKSNDAQSIVAPLSSIGSGAVQTSATLSAQSGSSTSFNKPSQPPVSHSSTSLPFNVAAIVAPVVIVCVLVALLVGWIVLRRRRHRRQMSRDSTFTNFDAQETGDVTKEYKTGETWSESLVPSPPQESHSADSYVAFGSTDSPGYPRSENYRQSQRGETNADLFAHSVPIPQAVSHPVALQPSNLQNLRPSMRPIPSEFVVTAPPHATQFHGSALDEAQPHRAEPILRNSSHSSESSRPSQTTPREFAGSHFNGELSDDKHLRDDAKSDDTSLAYAY